MLSGHIRLNASGRTFDLRPGSHVGLDQGSVHDKPDDCLVHLANVSARGAARRHTRSMTNGGTTQAANSSSPFAIVRGAPRTMPNAPIVITDMHQVPTIRTRSTLLDMQR
jgi:hypothetical protein